MRDGSRPKAVAASEMFSMRRGSSPVIIEIALFRSTVLMLTSWRVRQKPWSESTKKLRGSDAS